MKIFRKPLFLFFVSLIFAAQLKAQLPVKFIRVDKDKKVDVIIGGKLFTSYLYSNTIDKPVLYPLQTASGKTVTRGFPLTPRASERTDHPHHLGLWFNYGDVNGLDFWNNSYAIREENKHKYGTIHHKKIVKATGGKKDGRLVVEADWTDHQGKVLLKELTTFVFSGNATGRVIERTSTLTAQDRKVSMKDNKEGMLAIRVSRELEIPSDKPEMYTDAQGIPTKVAALNNDGVTGNFLTSQGKTGNDAWGTRANWCMMYGSKNGEPVSITIIDHPSNPGYPTYWHARGYGLFAANNLGQEAMSGGKEKLNFELQPGKSVTFRYKVIINNGSTPGSTQLNEAASQFAN